MHDSGERLKLSSFLDAATSLGPVFLSKEIESAQFQKHLMTDNSFVYNGVEGLFEYDDVFVLGNN